MIQEQQLVTPTNAQRGAVRQRARSLRLLYGLLIGSGIAIVLVLIEVCVVLLLNPFHMPGNAANHLSSLIALLLHAPLFLLVLLLEVGVAFLVAFLSAKPLAFLAYLREVRAAQEKYHELYTPLTALTNIRKTPDTDSRYGASPSVSFQEEQVAIEDLVQRQDRHQLILGVPGAGKTMALRVYQYLTSKQPWTLVLKGGSIPVYVPMKNYSLFLKKRLQPVSPNEDSDTSEVTLLDFLHESDLPGIRHLRPYLQQLAQRNRLLLLCDGLNEIDSNYLSHVSAELVRLMRDTQNRLMMTCREVDYREQQDFVQLVDEGNAALAVIYPLQSEQVCEFVERYVQAQDKHWQHTAGQIMQVIDRSRLRYHCTNPMMLFMLMGIIDKIGVERGKQIDTRGRLLRESVKQLIEHEQRQPKWSKGAPAERDVIRFLSEVACAARWANDRNAIQLRISTASSVPVNFDELADELQFWLDEHTALEPFVTGEELNAEPHDDLPQLLQFALSAALIEISPGGVLSFRHELIAEYFVAEYFFAAASKKRTATLLLREELLENVGRWSEPVAIWAGLLDNPLTLAERFGVLGSSNQAYVLQALALSLVCVGVLWTPPQAEVQRTVVLPPHVEEALAVAVRNKAAREDLARIFTRCAEEGGQEVYRSLLPLLMVDGVDDLLTLLDQTVVPELLFTHLQEAVDNVAYETQVKRLTHVLGRFGSVVVSRAAELSQPAPERSMRLRAAVINVLGGTQDSRAVEPVMARLGDAEPYIVSRAASALVRLGPELTLTRVLQELENRQLSPVTMRIHQATLTILGRFLEEQDPKRQVTMMQYQRILQSIVPVLTSNYQAEPDIQRQAREILVKQGRTGASGVSRMSGDGRDNRWERVVEALIHYLPSQNDVAVRNVVQALQEIGPIATPRLLEQLNQQSEIVRVRVIDVLSVIHDPRALPQLLHLLDDPSPLVQQQAGAALRVYVPESIPGLINVVLSSTSESVASSAAQILSASGEQVVVPVTNALLPVVPGRTPLLVQVLAHIHEPQSLPALISLLQTPQLEPLLAIAVVRALSQFSDKRVVPPLLAVLSYPNPQVYEEVIDALGQLGEVALEKLIAALDVQQETVITQRVRRALLIMVPFPAEQLVAALVQSSNAQAQQIITVFKIQGADAAQALVRHLLHQDERVRSYVQQTLNDMPGAIVVPALLEILDQPAPMRKVVSALLLKYPDAAISPLVDLLGERDRGDAAAAILPLFGPRILRPLVSGLDDQRSMAREHAHQIIVALVRQSQDAQSVLRDIVHLFNPAPPQRARDLLLEVLTNDLATISIPALLEGLEDAHLIDDASKAFVLLARKGPQHTAVLDNLLNALYVGERRRGAEDALIKIGAPAVARVGELLTDQNTSVVKAAKHILREIGVPALPFIWSAYSDRSNPVRQEAALEVLRAMRPEVIKDELIELLTSDKRDDIAMATSLLLERSHDELGQSYPDRVIIPELIEYVQTHGAEDTNLRIIALLLLLGEQAIADHLIQTLGDFPQQRKQLTYVLLLLGTKTQEALLDMFNDPDTSMELRTEITAVLGMMTAPDVVVEYAQNISFYGLSTARSGISSPQQLAISLRALGSLLASGYWNDRKLKELRDASREGSPAHELFSVLLGWRFEPQITQLQNTLQSERDAHKKEILSLTARIVTDQKRMQSLEDELDQIRHEHNTRGDDLYQVSRDKEALRNNLEQAMKDRNILQGQLERALQEKQALHDQNEQLLWQLKYPNNP